MSYVNRYIKNLKPSDLQLSLWGGDVVLSKLDLRLDVLEQVRCTQYIRLSEISRCSRVSADLPVLTDLLIEDLGVCFRVSSLSLPTVTAGQKNNVIVY